MTAKKCTKKRKARANLLFCQSKPISFLPLSMPSLLSLIKLPISGFTIATAINLPLGRTLIRKKKEETKSALQATVYFGSSLMVDTPVHVHVFCSQFASK